jgi:hypothetical protein
MDKEATGRLTVKMNAKQHIEDLIHCGQPKYGNSHVHDEGCVG